MSTKVLITDGMADNGLSILQGDSEFEVDCRKETPADELAKIIDQYQCIVIRSATTLTKELIEKGTSLKLIVRAGAGVDNIDVPFASEKKLPVMNTASANANAAAEQTIALMFSTLRQIPQAYVSMKEGRWDRKLYKGTEASDKTLGVIGLGNIGCLVAQKAVGLGMKVLGYDPAITSLSQVTALSRHAESVSVSQDPDEVISKSDLVTLHIPKVEATKNFMNADRIAKMKKGSFLINCARGGVVDENAVVKALEEGHLAGAAFDVFESEPPNFDHPMFKNDKIAFVPHLGASTFEAQTRVAETAAKQILGFFKSGDRAGVIN